MGEVVGVDRAMIRNMVEDHWRGLFALADEGRITAAARRFNEQVVAMTRTMEKAQADAFLQVVVEERQILIDETNKDRAGVARRLGVNQPAAYGGAAPEGLGRMAVKTAVRATIWTAIFAIFFGGR